YHGNRRLSMGNELQRCFTTPHSLRAIEREIEMAEEIMETKGFSQHLESYIAAFNFVLGKQSSDIREEYEDMLSEKEDAA
ncbi:TPA: hypothetical protein ACPJ2N_004745, partial [Vibrio alginolyticus]